MAYDPKHTSSSVKYCGHGRVRLPVEMSHGCLLAMCWLIEAAERVLKYIEL